MTDKKRDKPIKYPKRLNAKVSNECIVWFNNQAKLRGMNLSVFIREIATILSVWESQLDERDNIIRTLQEEIIKINEGSVELKPLKSDDKNYKKLTKAYDKILGEYH